MDTLQGQTLFFQKCFFYFSMFHMLGLIDIYKSNRLSKEFDLKQMIPEIYHWDVFLTISV